MQATHSIAPLVGRAVELRVLHASLDDACAGHGRSVFLTGEPGIGKTRLLEELATCAAACGARVLWGRCWETGGAPALWPWLQVLRAYAQAVDADELREALGRAKQPLRLLVPEWWGDEARERPVSHPVGFDSAPARFALLDAATEFLTTAAVRGPLVLILDDLHAADVQSLLLLRSLADAVRQTSLLVVGALREAELRRRPDAAPLVAELMRLGAPLPLSGLAASDVEGVLRLRFGVLVAPETAARIVAVTDGNPFLVEEVARLLDNQHPLDQLERIDRGAVLPGRGRDLISGRLDLLPEAGRRVLQVAALIGQEFEVRLLLQVTQLPDTETLHYLREATADGLLLPASPAGTRYRFRHALIREALVAEVSAGDRVRLHHAIGEAIEAIHHPLVDPYVDALAFHFVRAVPAGDWQRAVRYATAAGDRARAVLAYEDAAEHFEGALEALDFAAEPQEAQRAELLLALGTCRQKAGDLSGARTVVRQAADIGRALHRPDLLGRAALTYAPWTSYGQSSDTGIPLLEEAVAAQPDTDSSLRAQLLARLAHTLDALGARPPRAHLVALSREAIEMAYRIEDPHALARAFFAARWVDWNPASFADRWRATDGLLAIAEQLQDRELAVVGEGWRLVDRLEAGDPGGADRALRRHASLATELRQPEHIWWSHVWSAMRAVMEGRFAQAEDLIGGAVVIGEGVDADNAYLAGYVQLSQIRFDRGEVAEAIEDFQGIVAARRQVLQGDPVVRCRFAQFFAELGQLVEVRREFEPLAADDFDVLTLDMRYSVNLAALALACAALNDARRAAVLYDRLRPAAGHSLLFGPALTSMGPCARFQGLLAATMGRYELARQHFEDALAFSQRMGWTPLIARTRCEYASALLRAGRREERALASQLLHKAAEEAHCLGMKLLHERAQTLLSEFTASIQPSPAPMAPQNGDSWQRDEEYWTITYQNSTCRLRHSSGLLYLAELLRTPGREIHTLELATLLHGKPGKSSVGFGDHLAICSSTDAGEMLDAQARATYRKRLREIDAEMVEADSDNDPGRGGRLQAEREALEAELARAVGLRGRARRVGSDAERARLNVTRAIKSAIARIDAKDPQLGRHLIERVRTGTFCLYLPDPRSSVRWAISD
jgi:tetratricopeptide (TPR) repeat protein